MTKPNTTPAASASWHTPEPWKYEPQSESMGNKSVRCQCGSMLAMIYTLANHSCTEGKDEANAKRIVSCVNALAGMNPEAIAPLLAQLENALMEYRRTGLIRDVAGLELSLAALKA